MSLKIKEIISFLTIFSDNLKQDRSVENCLYLSIKTLPNSFENKAELLRMINFGEPIKIIFQILRENTSDENLSRIWLLLYRLTSLNAKNASVKIDSLINNLELNKNLVIKQENILKAQNYKTFFLGSITAIFFGIISSLAPYFLTFAELFRGYIFPELLHVLIPIILYCITEIEIYFLSEASMKKYSFKLFIVSSLGYFFFYFLIRGLMHFFM